MNLSLRNALTKFSADRPAVAKLNVDVVSAGPGFWVFLTSHDERSAAVVLKWARSVGVDQKALVE